MKKILLVVFILGAGAVGLTTLSRTAEQQETLRPVRETELRTATNGLAELTTAIATARHEIQAKKNQLRRMQSGIRVDHELIALLEGKALSAERWTQLREELGIGWNNSLEYVLVSKRVLKAIDFERLNWKGEITPVARAVLGLNPAEQSQIEIAVMSPQGEYQDWVRDHTERLEPTGDVVAQYRIPANAELAMSLSNRIASAVGATLGVERAELFLPKASGWEGWRNVGGGEKEATLTVRRVADNGESKLVYEWKDGSRVHTADVKYAHYPSSSFLWVFRGGWADIAQREGFQLPDSFP